MNKMELFLQHLDDVVGRPEDVIRTVESSVREMRDVFVFIYKDWPHPGLLTAFTLGLSEAEHPEWTGVRPELMISVESTDEAWAYAAAYVSEHLRGRCPFHHGETINFRCAVSEESELDAFLVFSPVFLTAEQRCVPMGDGSVHITGLYPMYSSELPLYHEIGLERFWHLEGWDPFDVRRPRLR